MDGKEEQMEILKLKKIAKIKKVRSVASVSEWRGRKKESVNLKIDPENVPRLNHREKHG